MYLYVIYSIHVEMHIKLVHIVRKQKGFDIVFCLGDAVFYLWQYFFEVLFTTAENGTLSSSSQKGEDETNC